MCVHPKTKAKLRAKLKELTSRSNGWGYEKRKEKLTYAIRGWVNYFRLAEMRNFLRATDEWLRSRIRMCIWKCWKRVRTRFRNLQRCGISKWQAWHGSGQTPERDIGAPSIVLYSHVPYHRRILNEHTIPRLRNITRNCIRVKNRRMPNGTYGGVRGR